MASYAWPQLALREKLIHFVNLFILIMAPDTLQSHSRPLKTRIKN